MARSAKTKLASFCTAVWLGFFPATEMVLAEEEGATYSSEKIVSESDRALKLLADGKVSEAEAVLTAANQQTIFENSYPPDVLRYPNLAFARFHYSQGKFDEVIRFAASIANAMNTETHVDHPYRIEARSLHARALSAKRLHLEALPLLHSVYDQLKARGDMQAVQIETLMSLIVSTRFEQAPDELALYAEFYKLFPTVEDNPLDRADFAYVMYMQLDHARRNGEDADTLAKNSERFIEQVQKVEEIPEGWRHFYYGVHGKNLIVANRYVEALPYLKATYDYAIENEAVNFDFFVNAVSYISAVRKLNGTKPALTIVDQVIELGFSYNANDHTIATFILQKGVYLEILKQAGAQEEYLRGYAIARRSLERDAGIVQKLKKRIDPNSPAFKDFALAHEFVEADVGDFVLDADGEIVLRLFFEGRYQTLIQLFSGIKQQHLKNPVLYNTNVALFQALVGNHIDSKKNLDAARKGTRRTLNSGVATNSPIFDLIELINKVVVTIKEIETVEGAFARLQAREETLSNAHRRVYLASLMHFHNVMGDELNAKAAGYRMLELPPRDGPLTGWDMLATATVLNNLELILTPAELAQQFEQARAETKDRPELELYRSWINFTELLYTHSSLRQEGALTRLATFHNDFQRMLPDNYPLVANAQLQISYALQWQNRFEESLEWMDRAIQTTAKSEGSRSDTVAFLMASKVGVLLQLRRLETAVIAAKSAYDVGLSEPGRSSMLAGVIEMYARAVYDKSTDGAKAAAILEKHINDPNFLNNLNTHSKFSMLRVYAEYLSYFSPTETSIAALERAEAVLTADNKTWENERSQVLFAKSRMLYWDKKYAQSFDDITSSSDLYFGYVQNTVGQGTSGSSYVDHYAVGLAMHEAAIGWDYAQSLSE